MTAYAVKGLCLVLIFFLLVTGSLAESSVSDNSNQSLIENLSESQTPTPTTLSSDQIGKAKLAAIAPFQSYKANLTRSQRKISSDLLYIIDPNSPEEGNTREQIKADWTCFDSLIPENRTDRLIINNPKSPGGDYVALHITMSSKNSTRDSIKPYIARLKKGDKGWCHDCDWVNLNQIEQLASIDEVAFIERRDIRFGGPDGMTYACWNGTWIGVPFVGSPGTDLQTFKRHIDEKSSLGVNTSFANTKYEEAQRLLAFFYNITPPEAQLRSDTAASIQNAISDGEIALDKAMVEKTAVDKSRADALNLSATSSVSPGTSTPLSAAGTCFALIFAGIALLSLSRRDKH